MRIIKEVLAAIKQVRTELSAVQSEVKTLRDCVNHKNELSKDEVRKALPTTKQAKCIGAKILKNATTVFSVVPPGDSLDEHVFPSYLTPAARQLRLLD